VVAARARQAVLTEHAAELMKMHLLDPLGPEEPHHLMGATFRSQYLCGIYPTRSYGDWWLRCDMRSAFEYEQRVMQTLHSRRPPTRWLLKAPYFAAHLLDFDAVHPDAKFVMTHRDPGKAFPSQCSLLALMLDAACETWDRPGHMRWLEGLWVGILDRAMAARDQLGEERFLDVHHHHLVRDPMGEVSRIYEFLGWELTTDAERRIEAYTVENRSQKHGNHEYSAEDFGLTADGIRRDFGAYCERFGV
jgi:hypothetical protein